MNQSKNRMRIFILLLICFSNKVYATYVNGNPLSYSDPTGLMEVYASQLPSGEHAGEYRYTFDFECGPNCVELEHALETMPGMGKLFSRIKKIHKIENKLRMSAGLDDIKDYKEKLSCSKFEEQLEKNFISHGYRTGKFSGTGLTEEQARQFLNESGKELPYNIKIIYDWDNLINKARSRAIPPISRIVN